MKLAERRKKYPFLTNKRIIQTTPEMRDLYVKHLDQLEEIARTGNVDDYYCYMCKADDLGEGACKSCPLQSGTHHCGSDLREINLLTKDKVPTPYYKYATPKSIKKHVKWMQERIEDATDCKFYKG